MHESLTQPAHPPRTWRRWLVPRPSDWVPTCLYIGVLLDYLVIHHATLLGWPTLLVLAALALLVALERWEYAHYGEHAPRRVRLLLFVLSVSLIELVVQLSFDGIGSFLYLILPLRAWLSFGRPAGYAASVAVMAVYASKIVADVYPVPIPIEYILSSCILFATAIAFVLTISHLAGRDRRDRERAEQLLAALERSHGELERSHGELAVYAAQAAATAAVAERNRVARDIHDGLGHYLTAINIQLEKALAFYAKDSAESQHAVQTSKRLAHEALSDVRRSVGLLRGRAEHFALAPMLRELVELGAGGGPSVALDLSGDEAVFPLTVRMVLYRAAQEGLTNIRRYARASQADLALRFEADHATLRICDDGVGFVPELAEATGGYGLRGLRERVALIGGSLQIQSAPGRGAAVTVVVPRDPIAAQQEELLWAAR